MDKEQLNKVLNAAIYSGLSAAIGSLIAFVQGHPELLGMWFPIVNVVLATLVQVLKNKNKE